jgi:hypothetical protein
VLTGVTGYISLHLLWMVVFLITSMLLRIQVISDVTNKYGIHSVSTDGGTWRPQDMKYAESKI